MNGRISGCDTGLLGVTSNKYATLPRRNWGVYNYSCCISNLCAWLHSLTSFVHFMSGKMRLAKFNNFIWVVSPFLLPNSFYVLLMSFL